MTVFIKILSTLADIITIIAILGGAVWGFINKNKNFIGFRINQLTIFIFRFSFILFLVPFLLSIWFYFNNWFCSIIPFFIYASPIILYIISCSITGLIIFAFFLLLSSIIFTSSFSFVISFFNTIFPKNFKIKTYGGFKLKILSAKYGTDETFFDVTENLNKMVENNSLTITASNAIAGDPAPQIKKKLTIKYQVSDYEEKESVIKEHETVNINLRN